ncbi:MAG: Asp-tRNA(Asn)/Glu-tRNA(Gln) amidotransferase subunit GatB, partial [Syntrophomonas sp.]|nr:Asp-tRNA(Asn)/Glu-tRNA(Gln) amidotransferase subunit GatB [Syntrophomonas sp.]
ANVSVRPVGQPEFGTRTEIKNLNSFRALERAIEYEARRQIEAVEDGEPIVQETRTWDEEKQVTRSMRSKEEAHDYRYFPEPDLPPLFISREWVDEIRASMPEMPEQAQKRLSEVYGLPEYDAGLLTLTPESLAFFDRCVQQYPDAKIISNWMMGDFSRLLNQHNQEIGESRLTPEHLVQMLQAVDQGTISGKMAKTVFEEMFVSGQSPQAVIKDKGLVQISDAATLAPLIEEIVKDNPKVVEDYKSGKGKASGFFIGQIMKATKGQANPALVNQLLQEILDSIE